MNNEPQLKVRIFEEDSLLALETKVNEFLKGKVKVEFSVTTREIGLSTAWIGSVIYADPGRNSQ